jgi:protein-S-isoprenylcysteine O-methyltransferase Ste14
MSNETKKPALGGLIIGALITAILFPAAVLGIAGDWGWPEGWIFALWFVAMVLSNMLYLYFKDPALLAERSGKPAQDNQKPWDKILLNGAYILAVVWFILMPLDAKRFGWSPEFALWLRVVGGLLLIPALYFIYQATAENTFLSTRVRIQEERKQQVISSGVYGFVRHPLYLGVLLMLFGGPLLLGALSGLVISLIAVAALVVRIQGEEKMMVEELEGYTEYKKKVKYRLLPLIW